MFFEFKTKFSQIQTHIKQKIRVQRINTYMTWIHMSSLSSFHMIHMSHTHRSYYKKYITKAHHIVHMHEKLWSPTRRCLATCSHSCLDRRFFSCIASRTSPPSLTRSRRRRSFPPTKQHSSMTNLQMSAIVWVIFLLSTFSFRHQFWDFLSCRQLWWKLPQALRYSEV
jgi:hypothetical protein